MSDQTKTSKGGKQMSTLHTSQKTHREMLPQSRALESVSADTPQGRDETGYGRGRETAAGVQHGRGEIRSTGASVGGRHPGSSFSDGGSGGVASREAGPNRVFVLDRHGRPLMPCHPARARRLLSAGRARVVRFAPFVIRLVDREVAQPEIDGVQVGVDPGSRTTGVAVFTTGSTGDGRVVRRGLVLVEIEHRGVQISAALKARAALRRGRRSRNLRYRQPRFDNRTRPKGWLPPSLRHRVETTAGWVERLRRWAPVTAIHQELVAFDLQQIENPDITGVEYQQGTLAGFEAREYVLTKWGRQCVYCGITQVPLNMDHVVPRSKGGSDRVSNLVPSCIPCNLLKSNTPLEVFLARDPQRLARIKAGLKTPLRDAAAVNATRWALWAALTASGVPVSCGSGGRTKWNRTVCHVPKTHALDALCVGVVDVVTAWPTTTLVATSMGRGSYARTRSDRYGFPRLRLTRTKQHHGYATGDLVRASVPTGKKAGTYVGRVAVRATGSFNIRTTTGTVQGIHRRHCRLLQRSDGWNYHTSTTKRADERSGLASRAGFCLPTAEAGGFPPRTPLR